MLGLICDPVAGLVEVPCVKRNAMGASFAFIAADMALAGIESKIPVDEVIDAMYQVGASMPTAFRETAEGGLATTLLVVASKRNFRRISLSNRRNHDLYHSDFFDLDGTLVDSSIGIHNAFTYTFKELGLPSPDAKTIRGFMGPPLESSFATCCPKTKFLKPCRYIVLTIRPKASMSSTLSSDYRLA